MEGFHIYFDGNPARSGNPARCSVLMHFIGDLKGAGVQSRRGGWGLGGGGVIRADLRLAVAGRW